MKCKRFLLSVVLPLLLAAGILTAGTLVPNRLLQRQKREFTQDVSEVPVSDVRPYGDEYESRKQKLIRAIYLLQNDNGYFQNGNRYVYEDGVWNEERDAGLLAQREFLIDWAERLSKEGYWLDVLVNMEYQEFGCIVGTDGEPGEVLRQLGTDPLSGLLSCIYAEMSTGIPVSINLNCAYLEYISPQTLWETLTGVYQERCGLIFGTPMAEGYNEKVGNYEGMNLEEIDGTFLRGIEKGIGVNNCSYSAVSTDFAFRLTFFVSVLDGDEWIIGAELEENT